VSAVTAAVEECMRLERHDPVEKPLHYTEGAIECIAAIETVIADLNGVEAYLTGQAMKYLWRWKWKNGKEDLEKARWYLNRLIQKTESE
jgi:hypothetical protein